MCILSIIYICILRMYMPIYTYVEGCNTLGMLLNQPVCQSGTERRFWVPLALSTQLPVALCALPELAGFGCCHNGSDDLCDLHFANMEI